MDNKLEAHHYQDLITIFNQTFWKKYNIRLVSGGTEPIYIPAGELLNYNQIIFTHDYYASALHEVAHWCLAGEKRRQLEDFGYWYIPDGRNQIEQAAFERVEIKPQAIEWAFCVAAQKDFDVSTDNLSGTGQTDRVAFKNKVYQQVLYYLEQGFPKDAEIFIQALVQFYNNDCSLSAEQFL